METAVFPGKSGQTLNITMSNHLKSKTASYDDPTVDGIIKIANTSFTRHATHIYIRHTFKLETTLQNLKKRKQK